MDFVTLEFHKKNWLTLTITKFNEICLSIVVEGRPRNARMSQQTGVNLYVEFRQELLLDILPLYYKPSAMCTSVAIYCYENKIVKYGSLCLLLWKWSSATSFFMIR